MRRPVRLAVDALAATQLIGWGTTFQVAAVFSPAMGGAVGLPLAAVLLGPTIMLIAMAFASPFLARAAPAFAALSGKPRFDHTVKTKSSFDASNLR